MKTPSFIKHGAMFEAGFLSGLMLSVTHMISAIIRLIIPTALGILGLVIFKNSVAWYWSTLGVLLMLNFIGAILPLIDLLWTITMTIVLIISSPFIYLHASKDDKENQSLISELSSL